MMIQYLLTPAAGKRLIAKALLEYPPVKEAVEERTVVIIAGTTNGYIAREWLDKLGRSGEFQQNRFFRGLSMPAAHKIPPSVKSEFPGDVVISGGVWQKGKTIFDVADQLIEGDVILKGANCINLRQNKAGIFIQHPGGGTTLTLLQAVIGRRVRLVIPAGLEKRIDEEVDKVAARVNAPGNEGLRLMPVSGEIITEIEALKILTGTEAMLMGAGGVLGAEGAVWLALEGGKDQIDKALTLLDSISQEKPFSLD